MVNWARQQNTSHTKRSKKMEDQMNWVFTANHDSIKTVTPQATHTYDLVNTTIHEAVRYGEREYGINLLWGDPGAADNLYFRTASGSAAPIVFGELFAINVRGGGFLVRKQREYGICLGWANVPSFEWRVDGGQDGQPVPTGVAVGLFNTIENDHLFYDPRTYGINLKWLRDKGRFNDGPWYEKAAKAAVGAALPIAAAPLGPVASVAVGIAGKAIG
jgi:hypothetical protein